MSVTETETEKNDPERRFSCRPTLTWAKPERRGRQRGLGLYLDVETISEAFTYAGIDPETPVSRMLYSRRPMDIRRKDKTGRKVVRNGRQAKVVITVKVLEDDGEDLPVRKVA